MFCCLQTKNFQAWSVGREQMFLLPVQEKDIEDIYFFEVNTKYISNVLKISAFSRVHNTSEIEDIFSTWDEIFLVFTEKN